MAGLPDEVEERRRRLGRDAGAPAGVLLADLETAYEELRTTDEEVRAQQHQITALVEGHDAMRLRQERMLVSCPCRC